MFLQNLCGLLVGGGICHAKFDSAFDGQCFDARLSVHLLVGIFQVVPRLGRLRANFPIIVGARKYLGGKYCCRCEEE